MVSPVNFCSWRRFMTLFEKLNCLRRDGVCSSLRCLFAALLHCSMGLSIIASSAAAMAGAEQPVLSRVVRMKWMASCSHHSVIS